MLCFDSMFNFNFNFNLVISKNLCGSEGVRVWGCGVWGGVRVCGVWSGVGLDCKLRFFKIKTTILNDMVGGAKL